MKQYLSKKDIPVRERLILALDLPNTGEAKKLVDILGDTVHFYKMGLELFMAGGYYELISWLVEREKKVFVDLKFFDVPETVRSAVRQLKGRGVSFTSVHGNDSILQAAVEEKSLSPFNNELKILAVTVLTSLDQKDIEDLGFQVDVEKLVLSRAKRALSIGCDGIISSGLEAPKLRDNYGEQFIVVTPGIRPIENKPVDDQKRTVDVEEAFSSGADYIVIGRPVRNAKDPHEAASKIQERIFRLFKKG